MKKIFLTLFMLVSFNANALVVSEYQVIEAIKKESPRSNIELEVFSGQASFDLKEAKNYKLLVSNIKFDDLQNKFSASVEVFADNKSFAFSEIMGRFYNLIDVYVPMQEIKKGDIIEEKMLKTIRIQENKAKDVYAVQKNDLVEKEAKKSLAANKLVLNKDVQKPILVYKNELTNVIYKTGKMEIATKAYATKEAGKGDLIELVNPSSKKTIMGKVVGKNLVIIEGEK